MKENFFFFPPPKLMPSSCSSPLLLLSSSNSRKMKVSLHYSSHVTSKGKKEIVFPSSKLCHTLLFHTHFVFVHSLEFKVCFHLPRGEEIKGPTNAEGIEADRDFGAEFEEEEEAEPEDAAPPEF
ncbi:hypothetical protein I3843_10G098300 [Carya illinoinensis]|nr:hypothetical protein I3843_10G098300 [Carya illinoinensis]